MVCKTIRISSETEEGVLCGATHIYWTQRLISIKLMWIYGAEGWWKSRRSILAGDVIKFHSLFRSSLPVSCFSLHMPPHHQLVHKHTNNGSEEGGEDGHQKPTLPGTVAKQNRNPHYLLLTNGKTCIAQYIMLWELNVYTYVKTSPPQPAMAVKRRGPKSLAGLTA